MATVDDRIVQCQNDIKSLQDNLAKLQEEKKRSEKRVAKVGDVYTYYGERRLIVQDFAKNLEGLDVNGKSNCGSDSDCVQSCVDSGEYKYVGNVFDGTAKWEWAQ